MGRPRKPQAEKADKRIRHRVGEGAPSDLRAVDRFEVPDCPNVELAEIREWWQAFWSSDLVAVVGADTDIPAVRRLATLLDLRERALRAAQENMMIVGSTGQMVENPLAKAMSRYDVEIRNLEDRFGLTPRARLNLGVQLGQARKSLEDMMKVTRDDDEDAGPGVIDI